MKITLTALVTAAVCFAITATTGFASHRSRTIITLRVGDNVYIPSVQGLDCSVDYDRRASFNCTDGGPGLGADVTWFYNRVEVETRASPTSVIRRAPAGWTYHVWRFPARAP